MPSRQWHVLCFLICCLGIIVSYVTNNLVCFSGQAVLMFIYTASWHSIQTRP
jgi:hypothetical protein